MQKLVTQILSTAMDQNSWEEVLDSINETFQLPSSCILSFNESNNLKSNLYLSQFLREEIPPSVIDYVMSNDDDDERAYKALMRLPAQQFHTEEEVIKSITENDNLITSMTGKSLEEQPIKPSVMNIYTQKLGIVDRIPCRLNTYGPWMDCFIFHAFNSKDSVSVTSNNSISLMMPIISGAMHLGRCFQALRSKYQAALSVLDALGYGVFLIDPSCSVIDRNKEAQRILDTKDGLSLSLQKELKASSSIKTAEINSVVLNAIGSFQGEFTQSSSLISIPRPSKKFDLLLSIKPLVDSLGELEQNMKCVFVTVIDPSFQDSLSADGLKVIANLSQAESKVVDLLIKGFKLDEVADRRNVSINTVKTQMKSISSKLHCSSQSEIIRAAAATKIPLK